MNAARLANEIWALANGLRRSRFARAIVRPGNHQRRILEGYLRSNADTDFGRRHRFSSIDSVEAYRRRVPLAGYDEHAPWIDRIRLGESGVLTSEPVRRLVPSSGSTGSRKLIPFTDSLLGEINRAIGPWIVDLLRGHPDLAAGSAYWSISPVETVADEPASAVPVGFDDDAGYLGGLLRHVVRGALAVPAEVRHVLDVETFRYVTLRWLVGRRDLRLISVWHPSFLMLLVEPLAGYWESLVRDVEKGTVCPPNGLDAGLQDAWSRRLRPDPVRAGQLRRAGPSALTTIWPRLGLISCWADGHAGESLAEIEQTFPSVPIQPKGLMATECFVTLPFAGVRPVAVRSHFFEFLDDGGDPHLVDELRDGAEYSVVVTTGGGLYRYRLGDRIRVEGSLAATPTLKFLGRDDGTSDRFGEKLSDAFVAGALKETLKDIASEVSFAMLAPDDPRARRPGYTLFLETRGEVPSHLAGRLEQELCESYHYSYCIRLGQLAPSRVFRVNRGAYRTYVEHRRKNGQRIGDVKPVALSLEPGWPSRFEGCYLESGATSARTFMNSPS